MEDVKSISNKMDELVAANSVPEGKPEGKVALFTDMANKN